MVDRVVIPNVLTLTKDENGNWHVRLAGADPVIMRDDLVELIRQLSIAPDDPRVRVAIRKVLGLDPLEDKPKAAPAPPSNAGAAGGSGTASSAPAGGGSTASAFTGGPSAEGSGSSSDASPGSGTTA
jgi:hypothetical protein